MPEDTYGRPLAVGDVVLVRFDVLAVQPGGMLALKAVGWDPIPGEPEAAILPVMACRASLVRKQGAGEGADDGR